MDSPAPPAGKAAKGPTGGKKKPKAKKKKAKAKPQEPPGPPAGPPPAGPQVNAAPKGEAAKAKKKKVRRQGCPSLWGGQGREPPWHLLLLLLLHGPLLLQAPQPRLQPST